MGSLPCLCDICYKYKTFRFVGVICIERKLQPYIVNYDDSFDQL